MKKEEKYQGKRKLNKQLPREAQMHRKSEVSSLEGKSSCKRELVPNIK